MIHSSGTIDLSDNIERMKWVIYGLANHYISKGVDSRYVQTIYASVVDTTTVRMNTSRESSKQSIRWAWKCFIDSIEGM